MAIELKVPAMGESVASVQIGAWLKSPGDLVAADDAIVMIESDKAAMELPAPAAGVLGPILKASGEEATIGEVIGTIEAATGAAAVTNPPAAAAPAASTGRSQEADSTAMPSARRLLREHALDAQAVTPSGPKGRILREDVVRHVEESHRRPTTATRPIPILQDPEEEQVVPMTPLRRAIATRLLEAQRSMALLTTFNEVDMTEVKVLRATHQEAFSKKHGVKLGFMSFFVRASVEALKEFPAVNAEIRGTDIVYKNHYDLGIAVGGGKGLVVPVLRHAESLSFAEVEKGIAALAERAAASRLSLEELQGGTFTISNGGVYGSLLSTPIVNPPQSAILGLHAIQDRVVARDGQPVVRPMMYLALTYDHRIIDGKEAVSFLRAIKDKVESPTRILLEI